MGPSIKHAAAAALVGVAFGNPLEKQVAALEKLVAQQALKISELEEEDTQRRLDGHACADSTTWYKNGSPEKGCAWVAAYTDRCDAKGDNGVLASTACAESCGTCEVDTSCTGFPQEPIIPGMLPGMEHPRIIMGIDIDYPPYGTLVAPPDANDTVVGGFGPDIAKALMDVCDIEVTTIQASWSECWGDGIIGDSLRAGYYHGCETYTHTTGTRNRYMDFSAPILDQNQAAGFITRLDAQGKPVVPATSLLSDVTIVDVSGWAPTVDTTDLLINDCTNSHFDIDNSDAGNVIGTTDVVDCTGDFCTSANDVAMFMLFNGQADVIYLYSNHAYNYIKECEEDPIAAAVNCDLWLQLGQPGGYAYIHTGMKEFAIAGTTLSISKKGSGLPQILDPCIEALKHTEKYYQLCDKWGLTSSCFVNDFFPASNDDGAISDYDLPTNEQAAGCANGYCSCSD